MRILFFGDGITQGFYEEQGGWAQRLINQYHLYSLQYRDQADSIQIEGFNLGIATDKIEDLLDRFDHEVKARQNDDEDMIIVIAIGTNNACMQDNRATLDVYKFQEMLEKLLDKALKITDGIICLGLSAVDESKTNPWPYSPNKHQWSNNRLNAFEDTIKQSALRKDVLFVPIHDQFLAQLEAGADLLSDGLHPNAAGHQLIYEQAGAAVETLIGARL